MTAQRVSDPVPSPSDLQDLLEVARRLPVCDRAARLHAIIARLSHAVETGGDAGPVAEALASAATEALVDDPWVQFEAVTRRFKAGQSLAPASLTPDTVHEREGHGPLRKQTPLD